MYSEYTKTPSQKCRCFTPKTTIMLINISNYTRTSIGIKDANTLAMSTHLSKLLADEFIVSTKTKNAHWNVEGPEFYSAHIFFESQYNQLSDIIDNVAERIRALGHYAQATLKDFLKLTHLTEYAERDNSFKSYIEELLHDHESFITSVRKIVEHDAYDAASIDFLTGLMKDHEKMAWMLRSHLN